MEVSRLASRFGLEPPGLVQMEKEIDAEEAQDRNDGSVTKCCTPNIRHRYAPGIYIYIFIDLQKKQTYSASDLRDILLHRNNIVIIIVLARPAQYQWPLDR